VAVAAGLGRFTADGSVVFSPPAVPPSAASVQRLGPPASPAPPPPAAPTVQLVPEPPAAAAEPEMGADELNELADRLYDPLLWRLRAELWFDRERAGLLADGW